MSASRIVSYVINCCFPGMNMHVTCIGPILVADYLSFIRAVSVLLKIQSQYLIAATYKISPIKMSDTNNAWMSC